MSIFNKFTTIKTDRLMIRPYKLSDLYDLHRVCSNERIGLTGGWKPHGSLEESEWILRNYFMAKENRWAIVLRTNDEFIGSIGFSEDEKRTNPNVKSLGYWMAEEHWGNGYMSEAVVAVVNYAFRKLGFEIITADCYPHNPASRRVLEKSGFIYEGTLHEAVKIFNGEIYDLECFYLFHPLLKREEKG
ncbi:MAG: GNAT family N-acetyltransferase [Bacteroidales bacterium]|nr:GNAT family N-acetyltransferase [Bacteroidales bacterium]